MAKVKRRAPAGKKTTAPKEKPNTRGRKKARDGDQTPQEVNGSEKSQDNGEKTQDPKNIAQPGPTPSVDKAASSSKDSNQCNSAATTNETVNDVLRSTDKEAESIINAQIDRTAELEAENARLKALINRTVSQISFTTTKEEELHEI